MGPHHDEENPPDSRTSLLNGTYPASPEKPDVSGDASA